MDHPSGLAVTEHIPEGRRRGDPVVVLVHGSLDRATSFTRVLRRLDDLHTVAYDRRGYHRSRHATPLATTLEAHADDLLAVIGGRPAVVVGHSYGGDVALVAALRDGGATSIRAVAAYEPPLPWLELWSSTGTTSRRSPLGDDPALVAEGFYRRVVGDGAWERLTPSARQERRDDGPALLAEIRAIRSPEAPFDIGRLHLPAVAGRGSRSLDHHRRGVAWLVDHVAGRRTVRDRRGPPRRPPLPPRRLRPPGPTHRRARRLVVTGHRGGGSVNILVAGSRGLIGTALVERLVGDGHRVTRLVRPTAAGATGPGTVGDGTAAAAGTVTDVPWEPDAGMVDLDALESCGPFTGVVNLAGAGIGNRRWSDGRRELLLHSRTDPTHTLIGALLVTLAPRPPALVNASAVGIYGDRGDEVLTEGSGPGTGFLADICRAWEQATSRATDGGIRTVHLRTGIVLSSRGGALGRQLPLFRLGVGGRLGPGTQYQSWITLADEVRAVLRILVDGNLEGPVNATAPEPATNAELARASAAPCVGRCASPSRRRPAPGPRRRMADELLLGGQRVLPGRLDAAGFTFDHPHLDGALAAVLGTDPVDGPH